MISSSCWTGSVQGVVSKKLTDCATFILNTSKVTQAAWASAARPRETRESSVFWKATLDGTAHFLRHAQLLTYIPASGIPSLDSAILWFATTDSVQRKVFAALTVFIIFACTVFVFDLFIALLEIGLVAVPLTRIAGSLSKLQTFEPDVVIKCVNGLTLGVKEVHEVAKGLNLACLALKEYKAFLPATLFVQETGSDGGGEGAKDKASENRLSPESVGSDHPSPSSSPTAAGAKVMPTDVSMSNEKGSFVKVRFMSDHLPTPDMLSAVTEMVENIAHLMKGTVHFSVCEPGTFYVSFNISRRVMECARKAAHFAVSIAKDNRAQLCVSAGMAHGIVAAGNIGSASLRGFVLHGPVMLNLHAAQVYAHRMQGSVRAPVVVLNGRMCDMLIGVFETVAVGVLKVEEGRNDVMHCLKKVSEVAGQEWMYELSMSRQDTLLVYFNELARGNDIALPKVNEDDLCEEQRVALNMARKGVRVEGYVKDALQIVHVAPKGASVPSDNV
eukprot:TRINITY_DN11614_c0_g1_i1.p1 TRINITY_DN11614_c0_g1~~TRINITY_DN11614_c0_g1_i1.p1  ORF type:complete len:553 (+),score=132.90 TRINITY_DN11614_c0_g1_i1:159-1661(+)